MKINSPSNCSEINKISASRNANSTAAVKVPAGVNLKESASSIPTHRSHGFQGQIIKNHSWRLFAPKPKPEHKWKSIAKFSTHSGTFRGKFSHELWTSSSIEDDFSSCVTITNSESCSFHYIHKGKDWLMGLSEVKQVKVSLYENGTEAAWAIFEKKPGADDNWFQPSRVIDSFPWDTELLRSSAEMSLAPQEYNQGTRFYIVKPKPGYPLKARSPHEYWMQI